LHYIQGKLQNVRMLALTWDDESDLRAAVAQGPFDLILGRDSLSLISLPPLLFLSVLSLLFLPLTTALLFMLFLLCIAALISLLSLQGAICCTERSWLSRCSQPCKL
jgi:hypothetical protein